MPKRYTLLSHGHFHLEESVFFRALSCLMVNQMLRAMVIPRKTLAQIPPNALAPISKAEQYKFIRKCSPIGTQRLYVHFLYSQLNHAYSSSFSQALKCSNSVLIVDMSHAKRLISSNKPRKGIVSGIISNGVTK